MGVLDNWTKSGNNTWQRTKAFGVRTFLFSPYAHYHGISYGEAIDELARQQAEEAGKQVFGQNASAYPEITKTTVDATTPETTNGVTQTALVYSGKTTKLPKVIRGVRTKHDKSGVESSTRAIINRANEAGLTYLKDSKSTNTWLRPSTSKGDGINVRKPSELAIRTDLVKGMKERSKYIGEKLTTAQVEIQKKLARTDISTAERKVLEARNKKIDQVLVYEDIPGSDGAKQPLFVEYVTSAGRTQGGDRKGSDHYDHAAFDTKGRSLTSTYNKTGGRISSRGDGILMHPGLASKSDDTLSAEQYVSKIAYTSGKEYNDSLADLPDGDPRKILKQNPDISDRGHFGVDPAYESEAETSRKGVKFRKIGQELDTHLKNNPQGSKEFTNKYGGQHFATNYRSEVTGNGTGVSRNGYHTPADLSTKLAVIGKATRPSNAAIISVEDVDARQKADFDALKGSYNTKKFAEDKRTTNVYSEDYAELGWDSKLGTPAHIRVIADAAAGGTTGDVDTGYIDNFILREVRSRKEEKSHIFSSLGDYNTAFFFGTFPSVYSFSGVVYDMYNQQWFNDFMFYYDNYIKGTQSVKRKTRVFIVFTDQIIEGFLLNLNFNKTADMTDAVNITFDFLEVQRSTIGEYSNPLDRKKSKTDKEEASKDNASSSQNTPSNPETLREYLNRQKRALLSRYGPGEAYVLPTDMKTLLQSATKLPQQALNLGQQVLQDIENSDTLKALSDQKAQLETPTPTSADALVKTVQKNKEGKAQDPRDTDYTGTVNVRALNSVLDNIGARTTSTSDPDVLKILIEQGAPGWPAQFSPGIAIEGSQDPSIAREEAKESAEDAAARAAMSKTYKQLEGSISF